MTTPRAQLPRTAAARPACLALAAALATGLGSLPAHAENVPLYISGSQSFQHDTNLYRTEDNVRSDTVSVTAVKAGMDKYYGRQNYRASALFATNRFSENDQLNNNSYEIEGQIFSEIGRNWVARLAGTATRTLASFDVSGRTRNTARNLQTNESLTAYAKYGLYSDWSIDGTFTHANQDFDITRWYYPKRRDNTAGFNVRYEPTDLINFGIGARFTPGRVSYDDGSGNLIKDKTRTRNIDFTTGWQITGLSVLDARLSITRVSHSLSDETQRNLTGNLNWRYTPRGLVTYNLYVRRTTGETGNYYNEFRVDAGGDTLSAHRLSSINGAVTTTIGGSIDYQVTGKINLNAKASYGQSDVRVRITDPSATALNFDDESSSHLSIVGIGVTYTPMRWLQLDCGVDQFKHSRDLNSLPYDATVYRCTASATLNGQQ